MEHAHLAHTRKKENRVGHYLHTRQQAVAKRFDRFIQEKYGPLVRKCLRHRYITLSTALSILIVAGAYGTSDHMGMIMMPRVAADEIEAGVRLPVGTTLDQAARVAEEITESTHQMFENGPDLSY